MKKLTKKIRNFFYSLSLRMGMAMFNVEQELKDVADDIDPKKQEQRKRNNNPLLLKMEQGQKDEKYVKDFYEVLKKADHFRKHASNEKIAMAAEKHGLDYNQKDEYGRRLDHFGFYDPKHKHYGKTLGEVLEAQANERKTNDDDFPIMFMINNKLGDKGITKMHEDIEESKRGLIELKDERERKKQVNFKLFAIRKQDTLNKIEQLTDILHIKKVDSDYRIMEFFIDKKFKLNTFSEDSDVFKEIINVDQIWFKDEWGTKYAFKIVKYRKRIDYDHQYEVIKLEAKEMEVII